MDALALLCTLHADGPRTTRRLRHLGVQSLDTLRELPLGELAEALESSNKGAERFVREAGILLKRVRHEAVDVEERKIPVPPANPAPPAKPAPPASEPAPPPAPRESARRPLLIDQPLPAVPEMGAPEIATPETRAPEVWSPPDAAPPEAPEPTATRAPESGEVDSSSATESSPTAEPFPGSDLQRYVINPLVRGPVEALRVGPLPASEGETHSLRPGMLDGLDQESCERLERGGVTTVEDLARTSGLDLALDLSWPYDRVFHLKKEASHYLRGVSEAAAAPTRPEVSPASPREAQPAPGIDDEGAAGPFA